ncbi:hypothetical protein KVF89_23315 [Nocardioides carbamazepini]|uniref:hypothetical protein n=1 Tax=Nocardioides carbamazepini TaxID=2854259 RepID=UPI002149ECAF|nr:hypothetical protein [Nocardioides carbamazepini]MCR1785487.1 hypothetical protein [Nocardioides carbamazepini]
MREDAVIEIWQRTTGHVLVDGRLEEFRARGEFHSLAMFSTRVLELAARSVAESNLAMAYSWSTG